MTDKVTWIDAVFGGKPHRFQMVPKGNLNLVRELEEKLDCGPATVLRNLMGGRYTVDAVREVIRLGMIGGGTTPTDAHISVSRFFDLEPIADSVHLAMRIMHAMLFGNAAPKPDGTE